jgi:hypothetical protein
MKCDIAEQELMGEKASNLKKKRVNGRKRPRSRLRTPPSSLPGRDNNGGVHWYPYNWTIP